MIRQYSLLKSYLEQTRRTERGASAVEYGLLVALIAAIIVASVLFLGNALDGIFNETGGCVDDTTTCN